jgi:integrase
VRTPAEPHLSVMNRADCPTEIEEARVRVALADASPRDQALLEVGFQTGLRLSELIGLCVGDVWRAGRLVSVLRISRSRLKGGRGGRRARNVNSRVVPLNDLARAAIADHLATLPPALVKPETPLFFGRTRRLRPLTRQQAARVVKKIFLAAGLSPDRVWSGHSLRRRFVRRVFEATSDVNLARQAIGHRWIATTQLYLGLAEDETAAAILRIGASPPVGEVAAFRISEAKPSFQAAGQILLPSFCASSTSDPISHFSQPTRSGPADHTPPGNAGAQE